MGWVGSSMDLGLAFSHFGEPTSYLSLSRMALVVEMGVQESAQTLLRLRFGLAHCRFYHTLFTEANTSTTQIQRMENRLHLLVAGALMSHCKKCGHREMGRIGVILQSIYHAVCGGES